MIDLSDLITVSGRPGLYKIVGQGKANIIIESISDNKRIAIPAVSRVSSLEEISIYMNGGDGIPLDEVFGKIHEKEGGKNCIDSKSKSSELQEYFTEIAPDFDRERVYNSDLKKLYSWYNLLHDSKALKLKEDKKEKKAKAEKAADKKPKKAKKPASKTKKKEEK